MTMADNLKFSKHKEIKGKAAYDRYDNYDAIEVPFTDAIPSDYDGVMGVPITFLDKYNPDQFEIVGITSPMTQTMHVGLGCTRLRTVPDAYRRFGKPDVFRHRMLWRHERRQGVTSASSSATAAARPARGTKK